MDGRTRARIKSLHRAGRRAIGSIAAQDPVDYVEAIETGSIVREAWTTNYEDFGADT